MKTRFPTTFLKLALCMAACFPPAAQAGTLSHGFEDCRVATADELDEMRGGFDLSVGGLHLSFSIDQVTFINGKLVATTSLNLPSLNAQLSSPSLSSLGNAQAIIASLENALSSSYNPVNVVQTGPNNTFILPDGLNLSTTALNTIIQNTLDNQVISNMTVLNATLNSQSLMRAMAISNSLNQMLNGAVR